MNNNSNRDYATENMNLQKEIAELKDQLSQLKEESENWQSAYEWAQSKNSILKLENQELKKENHDLKEQLEINETLSNAFEKQAFKVVHNYEQLKNAIKKFIEYLHKEPDRAIRKHSILQIFNKFLNEVLE